MHRCLLYRAFRLLCYFPTPFDFQRSKWFNRMNSVWFKVQLVWPGSRQWRFAICCVCALPHQTNHCVHCYSARWFYYNFNAYTCSEIIFPWHCNIFTINYFGCAMLAIDFVDVTDASRCWYATVNISTSLSQFIELLNCHSECARTQNRSLSLYVHIDILHPTHWWYYMKLCAKVFQTSPCRVNQWI